MNSKSDKLKERLTFFIEDKNVDIKNMKIPYRAMRGYKLDIVVAVLLNLLRDKFNKEFKCTNYEDDKKDSYLFNFC